MTDQQQLLERARAGSMDALAALYDEHAPGVFRVACRLLQSTADAEDVLQDVFVGLPRALRSYRGEGTLGAWIRQVAARTALMRLRSQRRHSPSPHDLPASHPSHESHSSPTSHASHASHSHPIDRVALERALAALSDDHRTVFLLKVVEGYSHDEIAALLDITPLASRTRLARARRQLERILS